MSLIPLANPLAPQPTAPSTGEATGAAAIGTTPPPDSGTQVQQPSQSGTQNDTGSSTSNGGTGAGAGGAASQEPIAQRRSARFSRPPDADRLSVVAAQAAPEPQRQRALEEAAARRSAEAQVVRAREEALLEGLKSPPDLPRIIAPEGKPDLPDPLPTSPMLKAAKAKEAV